MTIHTDHPFADPERDPLRRFRGRMPAPVTVWTTGAGRDRAGWTVSSLVVADGRPAEVLGLIDEDSDFAAALEVGSRVTVNLLGRDHGFLADVFAGLAPAPGGPFTQGSWSAGEYGPVLDDAAGHVGVRVTDVSTKAGWTLLVRSEIEAVDVGDIEALAHVRGRYTGLA